MYEARRRKSQLTRRGTPKFAAAHKRALERIPLGVASKLPALRAVSDFFVKDGKAGRIHDVDGNEIRRSQTCVSER